MMAARRRIKARQPARLVGEKREAPEISRGVFILRLGLSHPTNANGSLFL